MRHIRAIIITAIVITIGLIAAYLPARAMFEGAAAGQPGNYLPIVTRPAAPTAAPAATPTAPAATAVAGLYTYTFTIDRGAVPSLYYTQLSYVVHLGSASSTSVLIDNIPITSRYNPASGDLVFSTDRAGSVAVRFAASAPAAVTVRKAALKDDKAFAWSHGMDDNMSLQAQVDLLKAKGWRASFMLIGEKIDDTRQEEGWIYDKPILRTLRNQGWSLANHSWDHNCNESASDAELRQTIIDGYDKLMEIVASSNDPSYQILSFAAPCFISPYTPVFAELVASGATTLRFNESQGNPLMNVDGADYTAGEVTASGVSGADQQIGRNTDIEGAPEQVIASFDWMAANAAADRHFWLNTLSHGNQEANLGQVLDHAYTRYGPGGSDTLWMAPSDEIFSYLLVRDAAVVTPGSLIAPGS